MKTRAEFIEKMIAVEKQHAEIQSRWQRVLMDFTASCPEIPEVGGKVTYHPPPEIRALVDSLRLESDVLDQQMLEWVDNFCADPVGDAIALEIYFELNADRAAWWAKYAPEMES